MLVGNKGNYVLNEVILTLKNNQAFYQNDILTQDDKSNKRTKDIIADDYLSDEIINKIKQTTICIFEGLHLRDITRIDYRVSKTGEIYFIELNSAPRISSNTEIVLMCEHSKMTFSEFLCKYCDSIENRFSREKG